MKKIILSITLSASISLQYANAGSLVDAAISGGATGGLQALLSNGFSLPPVLGNTSVSFQCNPNIADLNLPHLDVCSTLQPLNKIMGQNISFKMGPCNINGTNPLSCSLSSLKSYCDSRIGAKVNDIRSEIRTDSSNAIAEGRKKILITGGDQYGKNNLCTATESLTKKLPNAAKAIDAITKLSGTSAYGNIANTRMAEASTECLERMYDSGQDSAKAASYCSPQGLTVTTGSITNADVEIASYNKAREQLASPLKNSASGSYMDEAELRNKIAQSCSNSASDSTAKSCAENIITNNYKLKNKMQSVVSEIESKEAARAKLFETASLHQKTITEPTEEFKNKLPIHLQKSYAGTAQKALSQKALIESFNKRISDAKKELATLMFQKTEMAAKPFYGTAESNKVKEALSSANAL